jgi:hypothetical protein
MSAREISERNFFHRTSAQTVREARVVNDLASTDLDAVETHFMVVSSLEQTRGGLTAA